MLNKQHAVLIFLKSKILKSEKPLWIVSLKKMYHKSYPIKCVKSEFAWLTLRGKEMLIYQKCWTNSIWEIYCSKFSTAMCEVDPFLIDPYFEKLTTCSRYRWKVGICIPFSSSHNKLYVSFEINETINWLPNKSLYDSFKDCMLWRITF